MEFEGCRLKNERLALLSLQVKMLSYSSRISAEGLASVACVVITIICEGRRNVLSIISILSKRFQYCFFGKYTLLQLRDTSDIPSQSSTKIFTVFSVMTFG